MKARSLLIFLAAGVSTASAATLPEAFPASRYESMRERSPFALATPVAPPPAPDQSFAAGWYYGGLSQNGRGEDWVRVHARDLSVAFTLEGNRMDPETRVKLHSVEWSPILGKTVVTISKDGQFAQLRANEADIAGGGAPAGQGPQTVRVAPGGQAPRLAVPGGMPAVNPGVPRPGNANLLQPQRPGATRPLGAPPVGNSIVTVPGAPAQKAAAGAGATTVPTESGGRRRIRSIPLTPTQ